MREGHGDAGREVHEGGAGWSGGLVGAGQHGLGGIELGEVVTEEEGAEGGGQQKVQEVRRCARGTGSGGCGACGSHDGVGCGVALDVVGMSCWTWG